MAEFIQQNWFYVPIVMAVASVIVNATPNETDNEVLKIVNKILNVLAANFNVKGIGNK